MLQKAGNVNQAGGVANLTPPCPSSPKTLQVPPQNHAMSSYPVGYRPHQNQKQFSQQPLPVGKVSAMAAQLRQEFQSNIMHPGKTLHPPSLTNNRLQSSNATNIAHSNVNSASQGVFSDGRTPQQVPGGQPKLSTHHQDNCDVSQLRKEITQLSGNEAILRSRIEQLESERRSMLSKLSTREIIHGNSLLSEKNQNIGLVSHYGPLQQAAKEKELMKTIEDLKTQLVFKNQEIQSIQRRLQESHTKQSPICSRQKLAERETLDEGNKILLEETKAVRLGIPVEDPLQTTQAADNATKNAEMKAGCEVLKFGQKKAGTIEKEGGSSKASLFHESKLTQIYKRFFIQESQNSVCVQSDQEDGILDTIWQCCGPEMETLLNQSNIDSERSLLTTSPDRASIINSTNSAVLYRRDDLFCKETEVKNETDVTIKEEIEDLKSFWASKLPDVAIGSRPRSIFLRDTILLAAKAYKFLKCDKTNVTLSDELYQTACAAINIASGLLRENAVCRCVGLASCWNATFGETGIERDSLGQYLKILINRQITFLYSDSGSKFLDKSQEQDKSLYLDVHIGPDDFRLMEHCSSSIVSICTEAGIQNELREIHTKHAHQLFNGASIKPDGLLLLSMDIVIHEARTGKQGILTDAACQLLLELVKSVPLQLGKASFMPLLSSGVLALFLQSTRTSTRILSVKLLHLLLLDDSFMETFVASMPKTIENGVDSTITCIDDNGSDESASAKRSLGRRRRSSASSAALLDVFGIKDVAIESENKKTKYRHLNEILIKAGTESDSADQFHNLGKMHTSSIILDGILQNLNVFTARSDASFVQNQKSGPCSPESKYNFDNSEKIDLARSSLAVFALLLESQADVCITYLISRRESSQTKEVDSNTNANPRATNDKIQERGIDGRSYLSKGNIQRDNVDANHSSLQAKHKLQRTDQNKSQPKKFSELAPLPVMLVELAESALLPNDKDRLSHILILKTRNLPFGHTYGIYRAQLDWQIRVRIAQESLTLLRGIIISLTFGALALDEMSSSPALGQRMLTALARLSRFGSSTDFLNLRSDLDSDPDSSNSPKRLNESIYASQPTLCGLPVAAWAYTIGSSTHSPNLAPEYMSVARGNIPCCSAEDVSYLARGARQRLLFRISSGNTDL